MLPEVKKMVVANRNSRFRDNKTKSLFVRHLKYSTVGQPYQMLHKYLKITWIPFIVFDN